MTSHIERTERHSRADARANERMILDAAARVLNADPNASMEAIAQAAGLARLTLYRHFATREALVATMTEEMLGAMAEAAVDALRTSESASEALTALFSDLAAITARYPSILGPQPGHPTAEVIRFREAFAEIVAVGKAEGSIAEDIDPVFLRQVAMGGLATLMHCAPDNESVLEDPGMVIARLLLGGAHTRD